MATGGDQGPSDECSVCLEPPKDPILLKCAHAFCKSCIEKLAVKDPITCPICREETKLPSGGIEELHKSEKLDKTEPKCGLCLRHKKEVEATHACDKCPDKLICGSCADMHSRYPPLKSHQLCIIEKGSTTDLSSLCIIHKQSLEYYCSECEETLCLDCIYMENHRGHEDHIKDIKHGVCDLKEKTSILKVDLLETTLGLKRVIMRFEKQFNDMEVSKESLSELKKSFEHKMKHVDDLIQAVSDIQVQLRNRILMLCDLQRSSQILRSKSDLDGTSMSDVEYMCQAVEYKKNINELLSKILSPIESYTTAKYLQNDNPESVGELETTFHASKKFLELAMPFFEYVEEPDFKMPKLMKEIKSSTNMQLKHPSEVMSVGNGAVIVVNKLSTNLSVINPKWDVIKMLRMEKNITSAAVDKNSVYVAFKDRTVINVHLTTDTTTPKFDEFKPSMRSISSMTKTGTKLLLCEDCHGAKIVAYDTLSRSTTECVSGVDYPSFLNTFNCNQKQYHIVSVNDQTNKVYIYDSDWAVVCSFSGRDGTLFKRPTGTAITPGGKVLIADYGANSVSEFKLDGSFVKDLLTEPAINKPMGILYEYPYIWVCEDTPAIKLFYID